MHQKIKMGGWPRRAPLGYLNQRVTIEGRSVSSVVVDPDRGPLVFEAFELYATGLIGARALARRMEEKGLRSRTGAVVTASRWLEIFRNPFYVGRVCDGAEEFPGAHPALVSEELFERVQNVISIRDYAGPRQYRHFHPLKGTLYCGGCGTLMSFTRSKGRSGRYDYFYCLAKTDCTEAYVRVDQVEGAVEALVAQVALSDDDIAGLREGLREATDDLRAAEDLERQRLRRKLDRAEEARTKLMQAWYRKTIDLELLGREQQRLLGEVNDTRRELALMDDRLDLARAEIDRALTLLGNIRTDYQAYSATAKRKVNRAVFQGVYVREGHLVDFKLVEGIDLIRRTADALAGGSNMNCLVELAGLEPATSWVRSRRSPS
jgi:site-specific DNA recombinase